MTVDTPIQNLTNPTPAAENSPNALGPLPWQQELEATIALLQALLKHEAQQYPQQPSVVKRSQSPLPEAKLPAFRLKKQPKAVTPLSPLARLRQSVEKEFSPSVAQRLLNNRMFTRKALEQLQTKPTGTTTSPLSPLPPTASGYWMPEASLKSKAPWLQWVYWSLPSQPPSAT